MLSLLKKITTWRLSSIRWNGRTPQEALDQISDVTRIIMEWPDDEAFSANEALRRNPQLQNSRESFINLVVHEYAELRSGGDFIEVDDFLASFPNELRNELRDAILVDRGMTVLSGLVSGLNTKSDGSLSRTFRNLQWPETGEVFAGFLLEEPLGRGGFSRVFVARELAFEQRRVALKICRSDTHEPSVLASLQHAGIGAIHSVTEVPERGLIAICMPLLSRTTLLDVRTHVWSRMRCPSTAAGVWECVQKGNRLNRTPPLWADSSYCDWVLDLSIGLARALSVSHEMGIVHCDIKPSNVLLGEDGRPILFDFNIAFRKLATNSPGNVGGTVPYMAPEHIKAFSGGGVDGVDARSDLFSLGATIYELLTGVVPFGCPLSMQRGVDYLLALRKESPTSIQKLNPRVPTELANLVHSCLQYAPEDRPASADEFVSQLERAKKRHPRRLAPRRSMTAALAASAAAVVVATGAVFIQRPGFDAVQNRLLSIPGDHAESSQTKLEVFELSAEEADALAEQGYVHLENGDPDKAAQTFERILTSNPSHTGAAIGFMRSAFGLSRKPASAVSRSVSAFFDTQSVPALESLYASALTGGLIANFNKAELRFQKAYRGGQADDATLNNLALCLFNLGRFDRARAVLNEVLAGGDAPDESYLLMVRLHICEFLSRTTRMQPDPVPLDLLVEELTSDRHLLDAGPSALKSLTIAHVEHACCIAYSHVAVDLDDQQKERWLLHSERMIAACDEAVRQGMSPFSWTLFNSDCHPGVSELVLDRNNSLQQLASLGTENDIMWYRRAFLVDPLVGTPFERWKAASAVQTPKLSRTQGPEVVPPAGARLATLD